MIRRFESPNGQKNYWVEIKEDSPDYFIRHLWYPYWHLNSGAFKTASEHIAHLLSDPWPYKEVAMKVDPSDLQPCCSGGFDVLTRPVYANGKWHDSECDKIDFALDQVFGTPEKAPKKCTCGSAACGSDRHSSWCDLEIK